MAAKERWRCLTVGCNPKLDKDSAANHKAQTGHRTAKWPVRSAAGQRKQRERNAAAGRYKDYGPRSNHDWYADTIHPFSEEAFE